MKISMTTLSPPFLTLKSVRTIAFTTLTPIKLSRIHRNFSKPIGRPPIQNRSLNGLNCREREKLFSRFFIDLSRNVFNYKNLTVEFDRYATTLVWHLTDLFDNPDDRSQTETKSL